MLTKKLHVKPGMRIAVLNAPDGFSLGKLPAGVTQEKSLRPDLDLVLLFVVSQNELKSHWSKALGAMKTDGALWVSYPKKSSGIQTDLGMGEWDAPKGSGWNPVAMVGVDDTWSSVRFKYSPGLEEARHARQAENITDADGTVCVDRANRIVTAPKDLQRLLAKNAKARAAFEPLAFTHKREYVTWIIEAKKPETRAARLTKTVEMLSKGKKNPSDK
jgi:Bacteriocin-protection, YdeI or OmpD-Associated